LNYSDRQFDYSDLNQRRFQPLSIEISEQNVQEGTLEIISILEKEKQAAKEIFNQTEKLAYLEFIDREIERHRELLNWPSSTSQTAQGNEPQTTGESTQVEKINWMGTQTQLAYLVRLLIEKRFLEHGEHWKMVADHYTVKGKQIGNQQIATAIGNVENYNKESKPIKAETLESIVKEISNLKD
jgi:hypothetical protein